MKVQPTDTRPHPNYSRLHAGAVFLMKRTAQLILLTFMVTSATFLLSSVIPGDFFSSHLLDPTVQRSTVEQLRRHYRLDQPIHIQYAGWLRDSAHFDFGYSLFYQRPVRSIVADALKTTLWIGLPALMFALCGGVLAGTIHALYRETRIGLLFDLFSTVSFSLPTIVLGLAALLIAARTHWFPLGGMNSPDLQSNAFWLWLWDRVRHLVLPVVCLAIPVGAWVERIQFAAATDCLDQTYVQSARARGLSRRHTFFRYILRPSLNPIISTSGPLFAAVLSGNLILEVIFSWPGLGQATYDALFNRDLLLLVGCVLGSSVLLIVGNLGADLLLLILDPRTRAFSHGEGK